jgi:hypothetical protein
MSKLTPELERFYRRWLEGPKAIPSTCRPHFYNLNHKHQTVFIMETPLPLDKYCPTKPIPPRSCVLPYVEACREALVCWFKSRKEIWERIARVLPQSVVGITLEKVDQLIDHVYFTDCMKCESNKMIPRRTATIPQDSTTSSNY